MAHNETSPIPYGPNDTSESDQEEKIGAEEDQLVPLSDRIIPISERNVLRRVRETRVSFHERLGNRGQDDRAVTRALRGLAAAASEEVIQTYEKGELLDQVDKDAETVDVAIYYIPGADLADVIRLENKETSHQGPVEKSPMWKVLTAGTLLMESEVQTDLDIRYIDITKNVLDKHRANQKAMRSATTAIREFNPLKPTNDSRVNIESQRVQIINASSPKGCYDLLCTCVEVDGNSLLSLIYNFRDIIAQKGKNAPLSVKETTQILETMVEDARRLLIRSPILSRLAQRIAIQQSKNTRYGSDTGTSFYTFTTSKGIAEMIEMCVAYYSTLQVSSEATRRVRPKVMQMVILLVALLNDDDLAKIQPVLEKGYNLQADRKSIELSIMKVMQLSAVGSHHFLTSVCSSFRMTRETIEDTEEAKSKAWDGFLGEIARIGWLLPGTIDQLKENRKVKKSGSWKVRWDKDRYVSTDVLDQLQYSGERNAVNDIPPLEIHTGERITQEVSADFRNNRTYLLDSKHLDGITLAKQGRYTLINPETKQHTDLIIEPTELFPEIHDAAKELMHICHTINRFSPPIDEPQDRRRIRDIISVSRTQRFMPAMRTQFAVPKLAGSRFRSTTTILNGPSREAEEIAISWVVEGRQIPFNDMLDNVLSDLNALKGLVKRIKQAEKQYRSQGLQSKDNDRRVRLEDLKAKLNNVDVLLDRAEKERVKLQDQPPDMDDEPILRVHFPTQIHFMQEMPWCDYDQSFALESLNLVVECKRYLVTDSPEWNAGVAYVNLGDGGTTATVAPLAPITEGSKESQIMKGDTVLLLGGLMAVVTKKPKGQKIVNFLKLTSLVSDGYESYDERRDDDEEDDFSETTLI